MFTPSISDLYHIETVIGIYNMQAIISNFYIIGVYAFYSAVHPIKCLESGV